MPTLGSIMEHVQGHRLAIANSVHHEITTNLPSYGQLPEAIQQEMFDELNYSVGMCLEHVIAGDPISDAELTLYRTQGFRRSELGIPFQDMIAAFHLSSIAVNRLFWQIANPENYRELYAIQEWSARETPSVVDALVDGYMSACRQNGADKPGRRLLIELLLDGRCAREAARSLGLTLAPAYLVLKCRLEPAALHQEQRRKIMAEFYQTEGALMRWDLDGITALLPCQQDGSRATSALADSLVRAVRQLSGGPVRAAQAFRGAIGGIPDAIAEAEQVLGLLAFVPGPAQRAYRLDELLIEYAISQNTDVVKRLADQLAPLDSGTELASTLETLYSCDLDRERAAQQLHIHRRTLTYRINRIRQLCGIDPGTAHGIALLRAALTAKRMMAPAT